MLKTYCDKCEKEEIPKLSFSFITIRDKEGTHPIWLCSECAKEFKEGIKKLLLKLK